MSVTIISIAIFAIIGFWLTPQFIGSSTQRKKSTKSDLANDSVKYHAVSIVCERGACEMVKEIGSKRFLSHQAPSFPMLGCGAKHCHCHYQHHIDRRDKNNDRRIDYGMTHDLFGAFGEQNRRANPKGRRVSDH